MNKRDKILETLLGQPAALVLLVLMIVPMLSGIAVLGYQDLQIISAPGNPPSGYLRFSAQTGTLGCLTSAGANCLTGIGSPLTTKGDMYTFGTANARLPVGTNGQVLSSNSGATNGVDWEAPISLTTTGSSGAATYTPGTPNVLNIPNYAGGGTSGLTPDQSDRTRKPCSQYHVERDSRHVYEPHAGGQWIKLQVGR